MENKPKKFTDEFDYEVNSNFDEVIDEKGNVFIALREVRWGSSESFKLDLRKWYNGSDGTEKAGKGLVFLTEDGPNTLTEVLVDKGYGETETILDSLKKRDDFDRSVLKVSGVIIEGQGEEIDDEEYFDPKDLLLDIDED